MARSRQGQRVVYDITHSSRAGEWTGKRGNRRRRPRGDEG